jgi:hypothetical protein
MSSSAFERFSDSSIEAANVPGPATQSLNFQFCKRCLKRKSKSQFIKEKKRPPVPFSELENYVWNDRPSSDFYKQCLSCRNNRKPSIDRQVAKRREKMDESRLKEASSTVYSWTQLLNKINEGFFLDVSESSF